MNVPCLSPDRNVFAAMTACARELAAQLGGSLVDDGNQPLSDASLAKIADQVAAFYAHMEKSGLVPGSLLAKRLFGRDGK
jgi:FtsZ-interacting cell division protein ZipA